MFRARHAALACAFAALGACSAIGGDDASPTPAVAPENEVVEVAAPIDERPNIVVFMTDDQTIEQMRALTRTGRLLTDEGMTFTQSVVNLPSCCPSRATFLTGQHASNHGVLTNSGVSGGFESFENQDTTFPVALEAAGYQTLFVGKYLNGFGIVDEQRFTPDGWSDFRGLVAPSEVLFHSPSFWVNGTLVHFGEDDYSTDIINEFTLDAIAETDPNAPFFAWVSYPAPHAQAGAPLGDFNYIELQREAATVSDEAFLRLPLVAPRHQSLYADETIPTSPSINEFDVSDKPNFLFRRIRTIDEIGPADEFYRATLGSLRAVDESIEAIVEAIEAAPVDRETWFVFTSDNGLLLGQHRHFGVKYFPYEEAVRVPLIIRGPGVEAGSTSSQLASNIDLAPTILDIAGVDGLREADGISLVPVATGESDAAGRAVLIEGFQFRPSSPPYQAVHTGDSVYVEWLNGARELYDLQADPYQLENLIDVPEADDLEARNRALLGELTGCAGSACHPVGSDLADPVHPPE